MVPFVAGGAVSAGAAAAAADGAVSAGRVPFVSLYGSAAFVIGIPLVSWTVSDGLRLVGLNLRTTGSSLIGANVSTTGGCESIRTDKPSGRKLTFGAVLTTVSKAVEFAIVSTGEEGLGTSAVSFSVGKIEISICRHKFKTHYPL